VEEEQLRILVLITDALGGHGGIAKFNRDLLTAMCSHPYCMEVVAIPRLMPNPPGPLPSRLTYVTEGLNGKLRYVFTGLKSLYRNAKFSLIVCGHINLLPVAYAFRLWIKAPLALIIHGIEAWQPTRHWLTNYLARRVDALISVSTFTMQRFLGWARGDIARRLILPDCIDLKRYGVGTKNLELLHRYGLTGKTVLMTLGRLS
jgi:phosphatidyl-myo-inositol dimannoside synthase